MRGVISKEEALMRIEPGQLDQLLHEAIDPDHSEQPVAEGLPASPGAAVGEAVFDADVAADRGAAGDRVVLIRFETTPDDIHGVLQSQGVLTAHGGMTSHAAVVARGMGKPCVAGARGVKIDYEARTLTVGDTVIKEGDPITLDGSTGEVFAAALPLIPRRSTRTSRRCSPGPTRPGVWVCGPMPTTPPTPPRHVNLAPRESVCAAPSTCSSVPTDCLPCTR